MPHYDYRCPDNGRVVEVYHTMKEELRNWGELCARSGIDPGETPGTAPVERILSAAMAIGGTADLTALPGPTHGCRPGCACTRHGRA